MEFISRDVYGAYHIMLAVIVSLLLAAARVRAPLTIRLAYPRITLASGGWVCGDGNPYSAA